MYNRFLTYSSIYIDFMGLEKIIKSIYIDE